MNIFKPLNQRGVVPLVVILLSIIGLIGFIILTNTFEFKDKLYSKLYPKTHTEASEKIDSLTNQLLSFAQTRD